MEFIKNEKGKKKRNILQIEKNIQENLKFPSTMCTNLLIPLTIICIGPVG